MEFFQIFYAVWIDLGKSLICGIGIFNFLDFLLFTKNGLSIDYISDLSQGKGIRFNLQGRMNGLIRLFFLRCGFDSKLLVAVIRPIFSETEDT